MGVEALVEGSGVDERSRGWAFRPPRRSSWTVIKREELDGCARSEVGRARRNPAGLRERLGRGTSLEGLGRLGMRFGKFYTRLVTPSVYQSARAKSFSKQWNVFFYMRAKTRGRNETG